MSEEGDPHRRNAGPVDHSPAPLRRRPQGGEPDRRNAARHVRAGSAIRSRLDNFEDSAGIAVAAAGGDPALSFHCDDQAFFGSLNVEAAGGYGAFIALGLVTLSGIEKPRPFVFVALTPLYWLLLSLAAWAALWEIYRRPHHWSKTPHRRAARPGACEADRRLPSAPAGPI